jgi:hypothetical protein
MSTQSTATVKKECERHALIGIECSGEARYVLYRHDRTHYICEAFARYIFSIGRTRCHTCKQPIWKCWHTETIR